jgi:hypothetical protein
MQLHELVVNPDIYWLYCDITSYLLAELYQDEQTFVSTLKIKVVY